MITHNTGLTSSVTTAVPMNSRRTASMPRYIPRASRAGRNSIRAARRQKEKRHEEYGSELIAADVEDALKDGSHAVSVYYPNAPEAT